MQEGWIKLHRKFLDWEWFKHPFMVHLFLHILISANHEEKKWKGIIIGRGQLITGRKTLHDQTGISQQSIRTCLERLKSTSEITVKSTNKFSIITICKYDKYQETKAKINQQINHPNVIQSTTNKKLKKKEVKEIKIPKKAFGPFLNVFLSEEEKEKLTQKFNGKTSDKIEKLSLYLESTGKKYKSHYATILNWSRRDPQVQEEKW
jgi:hydroxymethylpyrimidine pyrophosphatase-like HAD family hydrolase